MKTHSPDTGLPQSNTKSVVVSSSSSPRNPYSLTSPPHPYSLTSPSRSYSLTLPSRSRPQQVLRDSSNVYDDPDYDDDDLEQRLVIDLDLDLTGSPSKLSPASLTPSKMSTVGSNHEQHEATVDKGLKMKIKRKNMPGNKDSTNCNTTLVKTNSSEHNTENNGAVTPTLVQNSPPQSANSANIPNAMPSPFEKLKQAILEREKTTKGASPKGLHHKKEHHLKGKGTSPLSGNSSVAMGSPSGNPSGIPLNGVIGDSERGPNSGFGCQKSDLSSNTAADPYEFNVKVEDSRSMGFPVGKKLKMEKVRICF